MQTGPDAGRLTDLIYGAMLGERSWDDFLDELRRVLPNGKAMLFFHDAGSGRGAFSLNSNVDPEFVASYQTHYSTVNPWMHGASVRPLGRAVRADYMIPREGLLGTEFYADYLRPQGLESGVGVTIFREDERNFLVSVLGAEADPAVYDTAIAVLQQLVPHLTRAFNWYRQSGMAGGFGDVGLGAALGVGMVSLGPGRRLRMLDPVAAGILESTDVLSIDCAGRMRCKAPDIGDCIDRCLNSWMAGGESSKDPRVFLLREDGSLTAIRVTVLAPCAGRADEYFRGPECIVLLERPNLDFAGATRDFAALHGLTGAEERVVGGLAAGRTLGEIAADGGTSPLTVRAQLKQVFAKTGTNRQVDLVRRVCSLATRRN